METDALKAVEEDDDEKNLQLSTSSGTVYITVHLSGIHGNVNKPCPQAVTIGLSWLTAMNP